MWHSYLELWTPPYHVALLFSLSMVLSSVKSRATEGEVLLFTVLA